MATIAGWMTVREVVVRYPQTKVVLERHGIEYWTAGGQRVLEAAVARGMAIADLVVQLRQAAEAAAAEAPRDWSAAGVRELVEHIRGCQARLMRERLPRAMERLEEAQRAAGTRGIGFDALRLKLQELRSEVEQHVFKEDRTLFPHISALAERERAEGAAAGPLKAKAGGPLRQMEREHLRAARTLTTVRELSARCSAPETASESVQALRNELEALEQDLREQIHLENNVLFPRALALEEGGAGEEPGGDRECP